MKKLILLLAAVGMIFTACTPGGGLDDDNNGNNTEQPGGGNDEQPNENEDNIPESIFFGLDKENVTISPDGGSVDVVVYSNYKWEISGTSDWCTPSMTKGDANEDGQKVTFSADVAYDDREATFWFRCADEKIKFVVSQKLKAVIISDENNNFNIPAEGGIVAISYKTSVDCEVIIPEEAQDWITITPSTRGLVSESINLDVAENTTYGPRSAVIKVVAKDNDELVVEYTINQEQNDALLADDNNTFTVPSTGGEVVIHYLTNIDCEIIIPEEAQDWITITPSTRGLVSESINLDVAENTTYGPRSAVIKVVAKDNDELVVEYTINQEQNDALLADDNNTFTVPSAGGEVVIHYQTNIDCEVIIPEEAQDWITITPSTRGLVSESINLDVAENTTYGPRSAVIKVVAKDNDELVVEYTINQEQNDAILADDNNTFAIPGVGGEVVIHYQTNVNCEVIIPEEAQDWITIAPTTRGLVAYNTTLNVAFNNSGEQRSCVVKVVSQDHNELFVEYTLTQDTKFYIYYTSSDGTIVTPYDSNSFNTTILSNTYKDGVGVIEFNAPLTSIGYSAFRGCSSLTSVTIPDGVTEIGKSAFYDCRSLTSVTIPDSVTSIGEYAFAECRSLTSVTIPDGVTSIGDDAFSGCSRLTSVTIGNGVTSIGEYAFLHCSSLTSVTIGNGVTSIGEYAFFGCSSLTSVTIPDSVTSIGNKAFYECYRLTSVTIGNGVTSIGDDAFNGCAGELIINSKFIETNYTNISQPAWLSGTTFTKLTIGGSVQKIGTHAFCFCSSLTSVTIGNGVTKIGYSAFDGCSSLTSVTIGNGVTEIGGHAFYDCSRLTSVTIGNGVTKIGGSAFYNCNSLKSVTIPDSVTKIEASAFEGCRSLTSVTIPDGVTSIGDDAFYDCSRLTSVYCKAITPPKCGSSVFYFNTSSRIYVPTNRVEAYKTAEGWKSYASHIVGYDF